MERVSYYIDGFNLYFGMRSLYPTLKWLNVEALAVNLTKPHQKLITVKYYTSLVSNDPPKEKRQRDYLSALQTTHVQIIYGHYKSKAKQCLKCGHTWQANEEKMTDVNIAVHMIEDAYNNRIDRAILISGDSDLVPPIISLRQSMGKKVTVLFPPDRFNNSVKNAADASMILGKQKLQQSQFAETLILKNGYQLNKPPQWK